MNTTRLRFLISIATVMLLADTATAQTADEQEELAADAAGHTVEGPQGVPVEPLDCAPGLFPTTLYFSDFESNAGGWTGSGAAPWEHGAPILGVYDVCDTSPEDEPAGAFSGSDVWATNLNGCYANSNSESLLSQTFDFSALPAPIRLSWWNWYEVFVTFDMAEIIVDGGTPLWEVVTTAPTGYVQETVDLSAFAGDASVTIDFRLFATSVVNRSGWYVDDVLIEYCSASPSSRATFEVTKDFTDGNPAGVEVTISCNTGLPLEQSKVITEGEGVEFVVVDFDNGELDCEVTEDVPAGYEVEYFNGAVTNDISCAYEDVTFESEVACRITNTPGPVDVVIHKDWVIEGGIGEDDGISQEFRVTLTCESEIVGGYPVNGDWRAHADRDGEATITFEVIPEFPSTTCEVEETVFDSAVEVDSGCGQFEVSAADGHECTITNTVFFEGIPTLNQYGLSLLALLMLGVGFVGFRRFA